MNIYLDVDGVIIDKSGKPANNIDKFLKYLAENHTVYWLTTHCGGDSATVLSYLRGYLLPETMKIIAKFKPTNFETLKTEAIDFSKDFRWFDDYVVLAEKDVLKKNSASEKQILIDLKNNPNIFSNFKTLIYEK